MPMCGGAASRLKLKIEHGCLAHTATPGQRPGAASCWNKLKIEHRCCCPQDKYLFLSLNFL